MKTGLKRGLVLGMSACLAASSLAGCSKEKELDTTAAVATLDGETVEVGLLNFMLRYQQAQFETTYGSWLKSYYGDDIWNADLTGSGTLYGDTFKQEVTTGLEKLLLAEQHMADYGVEVTDEEKAGITEAAQSFLAANDEEVLKKMSADQANIERLLTLYTIQVKMEEQMSADVDTEVSDEEAAQRTVSYVRFDMKTEEETEAESETSEEGTEAGTESVTESGTESTADQDAEAATEAALENETAPAEDSTEASVTEAQATKTESADTEAETAEEETASEEKAETEVETEVETEITTEIENEIETETETEDEATIAARAEAQAKAEAFLTEVKDAEDFVAEAEKAAEDDDVSTSSYTFGDSDTYPDAAIIEATKDLEDNTLVDYVVQVNDSFYVLHVDDAFDEEATESEKEQIVSQRKQDAIDALYDEWMEAAEFELVNDVYEKLIFDLALTIETEATTETETEGTSEEVSEAGSEAEEVATEAGSEAEETSAETEEAAEEATEAVTEAVTEAAAETEAVTEAS